jgi:hypothetical protein
MTTMQMHWEDTPYEAPSHETACPICARLNEEDAIPLTAGYSANGSLPFLMLRGWWLEQMGFGVGSTVRVEANGSRIVMEAVANAGEPQPGVPTLLEREVHYTEVEPHTHHRHHPWSDV